MVHTIEGLLQIKRYTTDTKENYKHYLNLRANGPFTKIILKNITTTEIKKLSSLYVQKLFWI
jgi:hypothetical protein